MIWTTHDCPGTGGIYKEQPDDFLVEEIPLYPCSGNGEHLYLWVEKTGISTRRLISQVARSLQLAERDIGYAGLKDSRARTRQMISVPATQSTRLDQLVLDRARILNCQRHTNKLRVGHLAGNRFQITLRQTVPDAVERATAILEQLTLRGVANFFGEQRYGVLGNSAELGKQLLQGDYQGFCHCYIGDPALIRNPDWQQAARLFQQHDLPGALAQLPAEMRDERRLLSKLNNGVTWQQAVTGLPRNLLRLFLSATQAELFNQLLQERLASLDLLEDGDIAVKLSNGACFRVVLAAAEQERVGTFEISPSAPLYGTKVMLAEGRPGQRERQLLAEHGLQTQSWQISKQLTMPGERRALRVALHDAAVTDSGNDWLSLKFSLPKGSYATSVLREIIKA